jgi:hypothetical protein
LNESKEDSDELVVAVYQFSRLLRLFSRLERVNSAAVENTQFSFATLFWMAPKAVVRPKVSFSIELLRRTERAASGQGGVPATFATALLSLVAEALFGWLKRFFEEYGEEPWKGGFEAKWGEDGAAFRKSVAGGLFSSGSVALWCGLPLRIWVEDNGAVVHEFFPLRRDNIEAIIGSMPTKSLVGYE